jgi:hypothetical protein
VPGYGASPRQNDRTILSEKLAYAGAVPSGIRDRGSAS